MLVVALGMVVGNHTPLQEMLPIRPTSNDTALDNLPLVPDTSQHGAIQALYRIII